MLGVNSVLIVDDHPIVLQGSRRLLEEAGVATILEAAGIVVGYRLYLRSNPDVVVIDLAMHGEKLGGLALILRIRARNPNARILVFSMHDDPAIVASALEAGAAGYLLKDAAPDELMRAVEQAHGGLVYLSHELALRLASSRASAPHNALARLTSRELQTLSLLARGMSYSRIAVELQISYKTVVNVCYRLRQKLEVGSMPALIRSAVILLAARN